MTTKYYLNEYNDLLKKKFEDEFYNGLPTLGMFDFSPYLEKNEISNPIFSYGGGKFLNLEYKKCDLICSAELFAELGIKIKFYKYCLLKHNKIKFNLFIYSVSYPKNEYSAECFENKNLNVLHFDAIENSNKISYDPIFYENFVRLDKEKSDHECKEFSIKGFDIRPIEKQKFILFCGPNGIDKKELLSTTYKIKKL